MIASAPAGRPSPTSQTAELSYWSSGGVADWDFHLRQYRRVFPFARLDFNSTSILDVGSGPVSIFEAMAPPRTDIVPYDTLAADYNRLAHDKKFQIRGELPDRQFQLITLFNCLDHMDAPGELLDELRRHAAPEAEVWIYCHVDRPFAPDAHPQDFRFWHLVVLAERYFAIRRCGLIREGRLYPYAWWAVCRPRPARSSRFNSVVRQNMWIARCAASYARFHAVRAAVKGMKLIGLRRVLSPELRF